MSNLANYLTLLRLALAPVLLGLASGGQRRTFLVLLGLSLLTDALDGPVARYTNRASALGARLDSVADLATWLVLPVCVWWLWPRVVTEEAGFIALGIAAILAPAACGLFRFGRLPSYHTVGAKLSSVLMAGAVAVLLVDGTPWPFQVSVVLLVLAGLEEIAITAVLPAWRNDVPSLRHALALRARHRRQAAANARASARPLRSSTKNSKAPPITNRITMP